MTNLGRSDREKETPKSNMLDKVTATNPTEVPKLTITKPSAQTKLPRRAVPL